MKGLLLFGRKALGKSGTAAAGAAAGGVLRAGPGIANSAAVVVLIKESTVN